MYKLARSRQVASALRAARVTHYLLFNVEFVIDQNTGRAYRKIRSPAKA